MYEGIVIVVPQLNTVIMFNCILYFSMIYFRSLQDVSHDSMMTSTHLTLILIHTLVKTVSAYCSICLQKM